MLILIPIHHLGFLPSPHCPYCSLFHFPHPQDVVMGVPVPPPDAYGTNYPPFMGPLPHPYAPHHEPYAYQTMVPYVVGIPAGSVAVEHLHPYQGHYYPLPPPHLSGTGVYHHPPFPPPQRPHNRVMNIVTTQSNLKSGSLKKNAVEVETLSYPIFLTILLASIIHRLQK
ncbi:uncharacterized protein G2W53_024298 [Senna tora]|uniref:Uncharacterized protein n=1 Tax=Senna tora TaxID=362788 RepID=A0A834TB34_9FABA|nr:uncharacterized protein G2W53_024298 [Senna tora]